MKSERFEIVTGLMLEFEIIITLGWLGGHVLVSFGSQIHVH